MGQAGTYHNALYGMQARGFTGRPDAANSAIPLKVHDTSAPDLPPWKTNQYPYSNMAPQHAMATSNLYTLNHSQSDTYTVMNPAGPVFPLGVPPPQYEARCDDQLYAEIPGEHSTFQGSKPDVPPQPEYSNIPSSEKEDLSRKD